MKISVLWMTRKRTDELIFSISSFIHRAKDNSNVEYIVALDPDDNESVRALENIVPMAYCYDVEIKYFTTDKRYGYAELEQYQNKAGELFNGESLFIMNDDLICVSDNWDEEFRKVLEPVTEKPVWIGVAPLNERWKGISTFVGINRKWYEITGRVSGTRATDGYLPIVGDEVGISPVQPDIKLLHLQRGKGQMEYYEDGKKKVIYGLDSDEVAAGYSSKNPVPPKYAFHEGIGKQRIEEDVNKLLKWKEENE